MSATPTQHDSDARLPEISGYRLLRVLGHGGMSIVYLGEQVSLGREVAIKVMLPEALADEVSRRRFENEARTIARLEHPHIVGIHEVARTKDGLPYYAMPYLARGHLGQRDFTGDGPTGHARVRTVLKALLAALEYAHGRGVVHRDVKAENVLFDEAERPLLADFGIALRKGSGPRVTSAGLAVGSTAYMAPEQARGDNVDSRADLYSVGVLAWEMLTGKLPYLSGDALSMAVMHAQDPIPRLPRQLRHWQRFLDKALAKSPGQRFRSAKLMREGLERVPQRSRQPLLYAGERVRHGIASIRRWPKGVWIAALLAVAAGLGLGMRQWQRTAPADFFRVFESPARDLPAPSAQPGQPVIDITDSLLRPVPESAAERWIGAAERQLQQRNLTAPPGNNAFDSLLAAWKADPSHPRLPTAIGELLDAFGDEADRLLRSGDDRRARDYLGSARRLAMETHQDDSEAMARLRTRVSKSLFARVERAAASFDRDAATGVVDAAKALGLDTAIVAAISKRAGDVPQAGDTLRGDPAGAMRLVQVGGKLVAVAANAVSRQDYARFASATNRAASLCRERASLLRLVAPRSWKAPGFPQSLQQPVVCVSWSDADAYARWFSQRSGHRYRLPTVAEARARLDSRGARPVAQWLLECAEGCRKRMTQGASWRGQSGARALDATRGYDDVGIRLVRDP